MTFFIAECLKVGMSFLVEYASDLKARWEIGTNEETCCQFMLLKMDLFCRKESSAERYPSPVFICAKLHHLKTEAHSISTSWL